MNISVVLPVYNEAKCIDKTLEDYLIFLQAVDLAIASFSSVMVLMMAQTKSCNQRFRRRIRSR